MAQLRRNYSKSNASASLWIRVVLFSIILLGLGYLVFKDSLINEPQTQDVLPRGNSKQIPITLNHDANDTNENSEIQPFDFEPSESHGEKIRHEFYSLSYIEADEQAEWVAYVLDANNLKKPHVKRNGRFTDDKLVSTTSAYHNDYSNSGYTRGHLAPFGDMSFSQTAAEECFLMSNMSPQLRSFNNGVWKELEEQCRDWAYQKGKLYIVTGPVLDKKLVKKIGKNEVSVPDEFYKTLLYLDSKGNHQAIGFIIPNQRCEKPLKDYAVDINLIEKRTGLNLYNLLLEKEEEVMVESKVNFDKWPISEARYRIRIDKWNDE